MFLLEPNCGSGRSTGFLIAKWDQSTSAPEELLRHTGSVFQNFFENSADAFWLYDPQSGLLTDCNQAAVELMGAENKQQLVPARPQDLSAATQRDGSCLTEKTAEIIAIAQKRKTHRFEWLLRRRDRAVKQRGIDQAKVEALIAERSRARARRDFGEADRLREALRALGVELTDKPQSTTWRVAS